MSKFFLISILIASIAVPARAARAKNPREGLRKALLHTVIFNAIYWFFLVFLYGKL